MEHESFEDADIAKLLNEHFVSIKVDREERPDLDQIYMTALQLLTREGGGWPMSVFLTPGPDAVLRRHLLPAGRPLRPPGRASRSCSRAIADAWQTKRDQLAEVGRQLAEHLQGMGESAAGEGELSEELLRNALAALKRNFDPVHGGFGHAPKFPHAMDLRLLLRLARRFGADDATQMVRLTLEKMARGGIYDQLGGGFHRYSVDALWLVPHFEKMLYDNALLPPAYVEAFQVTGDPFYRHVAEETLDYVLREMTSPAGAFYTTLDADSEGEEGKFYVWSEEEIDDVLGDELAALAKSVYGVTERGNWEGHNILYRSKTDEQDARLNRLSVEEFRDKLGKIKCKLYGERSKRVWPGRDEKVLTAWNGLMIAAFAQAGAVFGVPRYVEAAAKAADFVLTTLRGPDGRLFRTCGVGQPPKLDGYLEDYAYPADALVTLYEATFDPRWMRAAVELAEVMLEHFADGQGGGFFYTADDHEQLIARTKDLHDGSLAVGQRDGGDGAAAAGGADRPAGLPRRRGADAAGVPRADGRAPGRGRADAGGAGLPPRPGGRGRGDRHEGRRGDGARLDGAAVEVPAEPGGRVPRPGGRDAAGGGRAAGRQADAGGGDDVRLPGLRVPGAAGRGGRGGEGTLVGRAESSRPDVAPPSGLEDSARPTRPPWPPP